MLEVGSKQKYISSNYSVTSKDMICDPDCGTAGFLIAASEHLVEHNSDTIYKGVSTLVGLDRAAAQRAFSELLNDQCLSPQQVRFVEMVIDQLTTRGVVAADTAVI